MHHESALPRVICMMARKWLQIDGVMPLANQVRLPVAESALHQVTMHTPFRTNLLD